MAGLIAPETKVLRHPDVLSALRRGERVWPLHVEFDLSNRCNLKCRHCDFAHLHDGALLDTALATQILYDLAAGGTRAVTFTGGGEPTTHPAIGGLTRFAHDHGLKVGLYTNGLLVRRIVAALDALTWVYVSLDACSPDQYQEVKGIDGFWRALDGVETLVATRAGESPAVGLGFLLSADTWRDAPTMAALAESVGADYCQFRPVVSEGADYSWVPDALPTLDALASGPVYVSRSRFLELSQHTPRHYHVCRGSALVPCVGADGTLWVCPNTRGRRSLGSLREHSFAELWAARPEQVVGPDCRVACRNHALNETLEMVCGEGPHDAFV